MSKKSVEYRSPQAEYDPNIATAVEVAEFAANSLNLRDLREKFGDERIKSKRVITFDGSSYVVYDEASGMYVKRYADNVDADIQRRTLNKIHEKLKGQDLGVQAVRVFAVADGGERPPASVIETAPGISLRSYWTQHLIGERPVVKPAYKNLEAEVNHVRTQLDRGLGRVASRTLVNDFKRGDNMGGNIFRDERDDGPLYTVIDQPFVFGPTARFYALTR